MVRGRYARLASRVRLSADWGVINIVVVFRRAITASSLVLRHGPRAVLLAREAKNRYALQKKGELRPLISLLRHRKLGTIVEIGTYRGGTLWLWCQIAPADAIIASIDLPGGQFGGGYDDDHMHTLRSFTKPGQELVLIRSDSHDFDTRRALLTALAGRTIDFLFIDGDHTYDGVKQDFEMYSPLVSEDGVVALHDIVPHDVEEGCEVHLYWDELKRQRDKVREFVDDDPSPGRGRWGGIGVVFVG
jgi:predicted O-methyltransferase YrrM